MARILGCQAKEPREKALQLTQRDCLNNTLFLNSERNTADICYWACFILAGQTGRL
jgi:hypothetical protein